MFLFFLLLSQGISYEDDLPFDDDDEHQGESNNYKEESEMEKQKAEEIEKRPISELLGIREVVFAAIGLIYLLFYILGKKSIENSKQKVISTFNKKLSDYFFFVSDKMNKKSAHMYTFYTTGRTSYLGGLATLTFKKRCDPIGFLIDKVLRHKDTATMEIILKTTNLYGFFNIRMKGSKKAEDKGSASMPMIDINEQNYYCNSDLSESAQDLVDIFESYNAQKPDTLTLMELSDHNRFELSESGSVVARFEFQFNDMEELDEKVAQFIVEEADKFILLQRETKLMQKNSVSRKAVKKALDDFMQEQQK